MVKGVHTMLPVYRRRRGLADLRFARSGDGLSSVGRERERRQAVGYALVTHFKMPGDLIVQLYEPRYSK